MVVMYLFELHFLGQHRDNVHWWQSQPQPLLEQDHFVHASAIGYMNANGSNHDNGVPKLCYALHLFTFLDTSFEWSSRIYSDIYLDL